jgi:hypothetical protein
MRMMACVACAAITTVAVQEWCNSAGPARLTEYVASITKCWYNKVTCTACAAITTVAVQEWRNSGDS